MRNRALHLYMRTGKQLYRKCKTAVVAFAFLCAGQNAFSQNVGVNTNNPDPSASLEVAGTDKGLLIPRIALQSLSDNATIPNPATALLIYNTNTGAGNKGFYYNSGTPANPSWAKVGESLTLPFFNSNGITGTAFYIENGAASSSATGIHSLSNYGIGLQGSTVTGKAVIGYTFQNGVAVLAEAQNTFGTALKVLGKINIAGPGQSPGAGKVLTSDADGNATWQNSIGSNNDVFFSANGVKGGGSQNIAPNIPLKVAFANQVYDIGNDYIDVNGLPHSTFFAPYNGIYHFDAQVGCTNSQDENNDNGTFDEPVPYAQIIRLIRTRQNTATVIAENGSTISRINGNVGISIDVVLEINDRIHVEAIMSAEIPGSLVTAPQNTFFNGRLVHKQ